jgi:hypothetical protein
MAKRRSNSGQTVFKQWSNSGQTAVKRRPNLKALAVLLQAVALLAVAALGVLTLHPPTKSGQNIVVKVVEIVVKFPSALLAVAWIAGPANRGCGQMKWSN